MEPNSIFGILSDLTRLRALMLIQSEGEACVCEMTFALGESQPKISRHLALMRDAGIVEPRREGTWMHYRINPDLPQWAKEIIEQRGEATVSLSGRAFKIKKQFLDDLASVRMQETIRSLKPALLILHSPIDDVVGIENAAKIFQTAHHPKSFISLDKADHLLMDKRDSVYAGSIIATWAMRYLDTENQRPPAELRV